MAPTSATSAWSSSIPRRAQRRYPDARARRTSRSTPKPSILIYRDGWYYLLVTHGSCCQGANSTYNIRMGRSRKVTGPYLDNMGVDMIEGGGKLFAGFARTSRSGPGISACWISARACRSSRCTTRPISIAAASACSTSARCCGATAGPWPATISRRASTRSNPRAPAPCSSSRCRDFRSVDSVSVAAAAGAAAAVRRRSRRSTAATRLADPGQESAQVAANWPASTRRAPRARHAAGPAEMGDRARAPAPADIRARPTSGSPSPARSAR